MRDPDYEVWPRFAAAALSAIVKTEQGDQKLTPTGAAKVAADYADALYEQFTLRCTFMAAKA